MKQMEESISRIRRMEEIFDAVQENPDHPSLGELIRYYEGGQWLRDYELDEQGLLPPGLKRGVLSQDGLHDFLEQLDLYDDPTGGKHIF